MSELVPIAGTPGRPETENKTSPPVATPVPSPMASPLDRLAEIVPAGPQAVPVEIPGFPGATSNFSGATSDGRLIDLWLRNKTLKTRQAYAHELERFFDVTGSKPLGSTTLSDLQEFADLAAKTFAPRTQRKMLAAVKSLFSFAHKTGYMPYNVGAVLQLPAAKDDLAERELTEAEVHRIINLESNDRNRVLMLVLYAGGLRREDVTRLKWRDAKRRDDIHAGAGQITVFGKGGKSGNVLLPPPSTTTCSRCGSLTMRRHSRISRSRSSGVVRVKPGAVGISMCRT